MTSNSTINRPPVKPESLGPEQAPNTPNKKTHRGRNGLLMGGTAVATALTTVLVVGGINNSVNRAPDQDDETEQIDDPITTPEVAPTVESISISAEALSDPDAFMETYLEERITAWFNSGATPENAQISREEGFSHTFAQQVAAETDQIFIDALLVEDWQSNPRLSDWVARMKEIHWETLQLYFATSFPELTPEDEVPYARFSNYVTMVTYTVNPDGSVTEQNSEYNSDNADQNSIGELPGAQPVEGNVYTPTRTFVTVNGTVKLSDNIPG